MNWKQRLDEVKQAQEAAEEKKHQRQASALGRFAPTTPGAPEHVAAADARLDDALENYSVVDAYRKWIGKSEPQVGTGQTESIKVSCPNPWHADRNPSAWLNTERGLYYCGACGTGGDVYDLAAIAHGMENYRDNPRSFHDLRRKMGHDLGWNFYTDGSYMVPLEPGAPLPGLDSSQGDPGPGSSGGEDASGADVTPLRLVDTAGTDDDEFNPTSAESAYTTETIDYRSVVEPGTFLDSYMRACGEDTAPDEYHLFNGLVALSLAAGRNVYDPNDGKFYPTMFVCFVGRTGQGKSMARRHLTRLLERALPYDHQGGDRDGVLIMDRPGSGEVLVKMLAGDQAAPGMPPYHLGDVKGYLDFDELSELMNKGSRTGSTLKDKMLELYDSPEVLTNHSLTSGQFAAHRPFCSVTTSTQPETMRRLFGKGDVHSGFLNRFVFVTGTPKEKIAYGMPVVDVMPASLKLKSISQWIEQHTGGLRITWSQEAIDTWTPFFHEHLEGDQAADIKARLAFVLKKIILLLSLNGHRTIVEPADINRAIALYRYLVSSYGIVEDASLTHVEAPDMEKEVLAWIRKQYLKDPATSITAHAVNKQFRRRKWSMEQINRVMKALTESGSIAAARLTAPRSGRPPKGQPVVPTGMSITHPGPSKGTPIYVPDEEEKS